MVAVETPSWCPASVMETTIASWQPGLTFSGGTWYSGMRWWVRSALTWVFLKGSPVAVLRAEDLGDGGVVVAGCQAADQVQGVFAGDAAVVADGGDRHLQQGAGAALPDDLDLARPGGVALAGVVLDGDGDLGDDRADEFLALGVGGGRGLEDGPQVGSGGGDPGGFLLGEGDGPAGLLGGELVFRGAHGRELVFQGGLDGPGDQPVLRLHVVVLAEYPAGFVTGPF